MSIGGLLISLNWKEKGKFLKLLGGVPPADIPAPPLYVQWAGGDQERASD